MAGAVMRPADWFLVDLAVDPTPGDAFGIRSLASKYADIADIARDACVGVRHARSSGAASAWVGDAGDVFRDRSERMPGELAKANDSYSMVADALRAWAESVDDTQAQADRGLQHAREAAADLASAEAALSAAQSSWSTVHAQLLTYQKLQKDYANVPPPANVTMPTDYQLRSGTRSAQQARNSISMAQGGIVDAQSRLDAAKRLVLEAKSRRDDAERTVVHQIGTAGDHAVQPSSIWEAIQDSAGWQTFITIATVVLTIVSIVALFVGGPIVWAIILVATVALLVNALLSIAQGKSAWGELALLAIGLIPGGRFLTMGGRLLAAVARTGSTGLKLAEGVDRMTTTVLRFTKLRPANVAINRVAKSAIIDLPKSKVTGEAMSLVERRTNEMLFRADSRSGETIFDQGFSARNLSNRRFDNFIHDSSDHSAFVSTSRNPDLANGWQSPTKGDLPAENMYRYTVDAPGGIDVKATYRGNDPFSTNNEYEITMPGGVRPEFIKEAWEVGPGGQLMNKVLNPNYIPKFWGLFG